MLIVLQIPIQDGKMAGFEACPVQRIVHIVA